MRKILEELWYGNITPQTRPFYRGTRYEEALGLLCKNEEKLNVTLEGNEKETFEKFCDCQYEINRYAGEEAFVVGFRLGARIIIESFFENDGFLREEAD